MQMRLLFTVPWRADVILINALYKKDEQMLVLFLFYLTAHLYFSLKLSAIMAINSEFVGFPRLF